MRSLTWAKGLPVIHPYHRARVQIETPLDFLVVSDHSEYMGLLPRLRAGDPRVLGDPVGRELTTRPVDLLGSSLPPAPRGPDAGWSPLERHLADLLAA